LRHTTSPRQVRRQAHFDSDTVWFYVKRCGRTQRCGITAAALTLLEAHKAASGSSVTPQKNILRQHKEWVRALALLELAGRDATSQSTLVLTESQVRFQLACDDTPELPNVLCF
jgi:hypothetical protein